MHLRDLRRVYSPTGIQPININHRELKLMHQMIRPFKMQIK